MMPSLEKFSRQFELTLAEPMELNMISDREQVLEMLAKAAHTLQWIIDQFRALPGPVDVEQLVLLKRRTLHLFGKVYKPTLTEAEIVAEVTECGRDYVAAMKLACKGLKKITSKLKKKKRKG